MYLYFFFFSGMWQFYLDHRLIDMNNKWIIKGLFLNSKSFNAFSL
jgi:hypothetical protein